MATAKTNQDSIDIEVYLRDLLECPVCMETIKSVPVYQCTNGHVICKDCIKKLDNCPICRNDSTPARNLQLEKIVQRLEGIQLANGGPTTTKPNLQKWGKGSVKSYGTINRPNQVTSIEINLQSNPRQATARQATPRQATSRQATPIDNCKENLCANIGSVILLVLFFCFVLDFILNLVLGTPASRGS